MTLQDALGHFKTVRAIANVLGISVQAVYAWGPTVPDLRAYQLREIIESPAKQSKHPQRVAA